METNGCLEGQKRNYEYYGNILEMVCTNISYLIYYIKTKTHKTTGPVSIKQSVHLHLLTNLLLNLRGLHSTQYYETGSGMTVQYSIGHDGLSVIYSNVYNSNAFL